MEELGNRRGDFEVKKKLLRIRWQYLLLCGVEQVFELVLLNNGCVLRLKLLIGVIFSVQVNP